MCPSRKPVSLLRELSLDFYYSMLGLSSLLKECLTTRAEGRELLAAAAGPGFR